MGPLNILKSLPLCAVVMLAYMTGQTYADETSQPDFTIRQGGNERMVKIQHLFPKWIQVFGLHLVATKEVPSDKIIHAAKVTAAYLDNDQDGLPDHPAVNRALWQGYGGIIMASSESQAERLLDTAGDALDAYTLQLLFADETRPRGAPHHPDGIDFDFALEEILHIITQLGYATIYPDIFGEHPGSDLANAMDIARSGRFQRVPQTYPPSAWYTYDDTSCDYACQVTEYIYWALTSLLGGQDFRGRGSEIENEWQLNTPQEVKDRDAAVFKILSNPLYALPTILPDGRYEVNKPATGGAPSDETGTLRGIYRAVEIEWQGSQGVSFELQETRDLEHWNTIRKVLGTGEPLSLFLRAKPYPTFWRLQP
ncbi:hypothetical protein OAK97_00800 [bacterium]|nr:hypothetical protein [bacterium]